MGLLAFLSEVQYPQHICTSLCAEEAIPERCGNYDHTLYDSLTPTEVPLRVEDTEVTLLREKHDCP